MIACLNLSCAAIDSPLKGTTSSIDLIHIHKKARKLDLYHKGKLLKTYRVSLGFAPIGHKEQEGDGKTPEGIYTISSKNNKSQYHLSLKISYPNKIDIKKAQKNNLSPGGDIMIHGLGKGFSWMGAAHRFRDWTLGCIAVTNKEIEEIFAATPVGTKVEIFS